MSVHFTVVPTGTGTPTGSVQVSDGVDNCTGTVASGTCNISLSTNAARTLTAHYVGDANYNASTSTGEPHAVDAISPDTSIATHPPNPTSSTSASFSFGGSDPGGGVASFECKLDAGSFSACTSPKSYSGLSDGSHTFQVRAIDGVGNVDPTPDSFTWTIDTFPPTVTIEQASGQADPSGDSTIHFALGISATAENIRRINAASQSRMRSSSVARTERW